MADFVNAFLSSADNRVKENDLRARRLQVYTQAEEQNIRTQETHDLQMQRGQVGLDVAKLSKEQLGLQLETMKNKLDEYYVNDFDKALETAHDSGDLTLMKNLIRKDKTSELFGQITDIQKFEDSPDAEDLMSEVLDGVDTSKLDLKGKIALARKLAPDAIVITRPDGKKELASISGLMKSFGYTNRQNKAKSARFVAAAQAGNLKALYALAKHYGDEEKAKQYAEAIKETQKQAGSAERRMHSFNYLDGLAMGEQEARNKGLTPGSEEFKNFSEKYAAEYIDYATGTAKTKDAHKLSKSVTDNKYLEEYQAKANSPLYKKNDIAVAQLSSVLKQNPDMTIEELSSSLSGSSEKVNTQNLIAKMKQLGYDKTTKIGEIPAAELITVVKEDNPSMFTTDATDKAQFLSNARAVNWAYKNIPDFAEKVHIQRKNIKADDKSSYEVLNRVAPQMVALNSFDRIVNTIAQSKTPKNFLTGMSDWLSSYAPTVTDSGIEKELADGIDTKASDYATRLGLEAANTASVSAILKATSGLTVSDKERRVILDMLGDFSSMADIKKFIHSVRGYSKEIQNQLRDDMTMIAHSYPELASHTLASIEELRAKKAVKEYKKVQEKKKNRPIDEIPVDEIMADLLKGL